MSIQKQFIVRYRAEGHVRFQGPEQLSDVELAQQLTNKISAIDGVYGVTVFRRQRKLSIRYQEAAIDFVALAKRLFQLIAELDKQGDFERKAVQKVEPALKSRLQQKFKNLKVSRWANEKYGEAKETVQAAKVITKLGLKKPNALVKDPEKAIIDFFNDILVLYLIKLHWTRITQEWIPRPIVHRYEWMAVFYMFYLLIRSRRPKK
ncbi:hypothetical protein Q9L42_001290 [Methylomarinum sp. Ch1-1]|uniref:Uncharacterized protein n=1 Tax=Methylomarinum roseum TaxID=3067653 RepID=A0AAU7NV22_9GAMM|nr:hypothetical protein [Methylomarinum sp. Ch1-1]MDP4519108.1 hypothetical protein [Methylomarinum sp. Ch1-1]